VPAPADWGDDMAAPPTARAPNPSDTPLLLSTADTRCCNKKDQPFIGLHLSQASSN
jgi:hypothetical protein